MKIIIPIFLVLICYGCGYRTEPTEFLTPYRTIAIPYIHNDVTGLATSTLIKTISIESGLQYQTHGADLTLLVDLVELENDNIGFKYERRNDGSLRHSIIPSESRVSTVAEVTLIDNANGEKIAGPVRILGTADFDHEYEKTRNGVNVFSLGQLTDYTEAYDAACTPLYVNLSRKIAEFILSL